MIDQLITQELSDVFFNLTYEEQNETILTLVKGLQAKRRLDIEKSQEQTEYIQKNFDFLKESLCNASNLLK